MRIAFLALAFFCVSTPAMAAKVVVLPSLHRVEATGVEADKAAAMVHESVLRAVADANVEPVDRTTMMTALKQVSSVDPTHCREQPCLKKLAEHLGAEQAVFVTVVELGEMEHEIKMTLAYGDSVKEVLKDGLYVVLAQVRRVVGLALKELETRDDTESVEEEFAKRERELMPLEPTRDKETARKIPPWLFYTTLGTSLAITATWISLEAVGYNRADELRSGEKSMAYWETSKDIQTASRTFFGLSMATLTTTIVMAFFTDFGGDAKKTRAYNFGWMAGENRGAIAFGGRF